MIRRHVWVFSSLLRNPPRPGVVRNLYVRAVVLVGVGASHFLTLRHELVHDRILIPQGL